MAGRGPAPKPAEQRRRRNADPVGSTVLAKSKRPKGPTLIQATGRSKWSKQTQAWWNTWRTSPQAAAFLATDWQRLAMLAPLVERYWFQPQTAILAEIRLNEERLGATVVDRQRARMQFDTKDSAPVAPVLSLVDARKRMASRLSS